jgi:hypothetical protein
VMLRNIWEKDGSICLGFEVEGGWQVGVSSTRATRYQVMIIHRLVIAKTSSKHFLNWSYEFQYSCMLWLMYFMLNAPLTITLVYFMHMNSFCVSCLNYYFMYTFRCRWTIFAFLSYVLLGLSSQTSFLTCNLYGYTINSI